MTLSLVDESVQEFTILVGDTNKAPSFTFKDIFSKIFWVVTWESFVANLWNFSGWNWMNWTMVVIVGLIVLAVLGGVIFQKKRRTRRQKASLVFQLTGKKRK